MHILMLITIYLSIHPSIFVQLEISTKKKIFTEKKFKMYLIFPLQIFVCIGLSKFHIWNYV